MPESVLRRPNGRLQACDRCRRRKVACDHTQPACFRCTKGRKSCVYSSSGPGSLNGLPPSSASHGGWSPNTARPRDSQSQRPRAYGYLGTTSSVAAFRETRVNLSLLGEAPESPEQSYDVEIEGPILSPDIRELCLACLRIIPARAEFTFPDLREAGTSSFFYSHLNQCVATILSSLYDVWGEYFQLETRTDTKLEAMARTICANSSKPFSDTISNPTAWMGQFTGHNLRWESLGLLFNRLEAERSLVDTADGQHKDVQNMRQYAHARLQAIKPCVQLCEEFSEMNSLIMVLYERRTTYESVLSGDASLSTWRYHSQAVSLVTFHGMHDEPRSTHYQPTLASETRRRLTSFLFAIDNTFATFTGRPPILGLKYMSTPLPLDLEDSDLYKDPDALAQSVLETVDERGWNRTGKLFSSTFLRARAILAYIRAEIIETSLATNNMVTVEQIEQIKSKQALAVSEFPAGLMFRLEEIGKPNADTTYPFHRLRTRLNVLMNDFLLNRLLTRQGLPDDGNLLLVAYELVAITLACWTHIDLFTKERDFDFILLTYGAPAGGVLCMELLKPTFQGCHPKDPQITRSSIIQKLSLLLGFFDWISPTAANTALCEQCKVTVKRVLDTTLNGPSYDPNAPATALDWDFTAHVDFNFDLLDTFGWLRSDS